MEENEVGQKKDWSLALFFFGISVFLIIAPFGYQFYLSKKMVPKTRAKLLNLKTALMMYNIDIGAFPFIGKEPSIKSYELANRFCLGSSFTSNVLVNDAVGFPFQNCGIEGYEKRWKGPYMDSDPSEFMVDGWGVKIRYRVVFQFSFYSIFLHSAGPDRNFDPLQKVIESDYKGDDLSQQVSKIRLRVLTPAELLPQSFLASPGEDLQPIIATDSR